MDLECCFRWEVRLCWLLGIRWCKSYQEHCVPSVQQVGKKKCINFSCYVCTPGDKCCQKGGGQEDQDDSISHLNLYKTQKGKVAMPSDQTWQVLRLSSKFHSSWFVGSFFLNLAVLEKYIVSLVWLGFLATLLEKRTKKWTLKTQRLEFKLTYYYYFEIFWMSG